MSNNMFETIKEVQMYNEFLEAITGVELLDLVMEGRPLYDKYIGGKVPIPEEHKLAIVMYGIAKLTVNGEDDGFTE